MDERKCWIWLSGIDGVNVSAFFILTSFYGSAGEVYKNAAVLEPIEGLKKETISNIAKCANEAYAEDFFGVLEKKRIRTVCMLDDEYPWLLSDTYLPPAVLYVMGNAPINLERTIGMVGTRRCTRYGAQAAGDISKELAKEGVTIISGLASGIDTASHEGALNAGGYTYAVLGCGADVIYPKDNEALYKTIMERGAIISEFSPGVKPLPQNFPVRNRIISGMSYGVVIVEAPEKSGANITASLALEQGRDVFAVPGGIYSKTSAGTNKLISEGAGVVLSASDILLRYGWQSKVKAKKEAVKHDLNDQERLIANELEKGDLDIDSLSDITSIDIKTLNSILTMMEVRGIIKQLPGKSFTLV